MNTHLTLEALTAAVRNRQPPAGRIRHTDRGSQYASQPYRQALADYCLRGSMSAAAIPYDNAQSESFMKTLKAEQIYLAGYEIFEEVVAKLPQFIQENRNAMRLRSALDYVPPNEFEETLARQAA